jgi:hypothetical protein
VARQRGRDAEHPARDQHPALAGPRVRRAARGVVREQGRDRACHGYRCVRSRFFWCSFRRIWLGISRDMTLFHIYIYIYRIVVFYYYYCGFLLLFLWYLVGNRARHGYRWVRRELALLLVLISSKLVGY